MSDNYFAPGDWNAVCFRCGCQRKASELKKQWQGFYVCPEHWEPRQPQDFVRTVSDIQTVPWSQPDTDVYVGPLIALCTVSGKSAIPGLMQPACIIPNNGVQDQFQ